MQRANKLFNIVQRMDMRSSLAPTLIACLASCPSVKDQPHVAVAIMEHLLAANALFTNEQKACRKGDLSGAR